MGKKIPNTSGLLVFANLENNVLDLSSLEKGIYFLQVEGFETKRIMIK